MKSNSEYLKILLVGLMLKINKLNWGLNLRQWKPFKVKKILLISLIFIKKEDDFFLSLMFWLVLTSGLAILRFTILDEIILLIACIVIIIKSILKKNIKIKKKFNFSEILFLLFILIIFFQSIFGLFNSIKSLRFILIYFSIATLFFFFISNKKFSCNLEKIVNICSNAVIIHYLITIFIWFINYYYLKILGSIYCNNYF